jgi:hypothetical protein
VDRTDGVPLLIEELTKSVIKSGTVSEAGDHDVVVADGNIGRNLRQRGSAVHT